MELQEQIPTRTEIRNLEHVGFSSEEIAELSRDYNACATEDVAWGRSFSVVVVR